MPKYRIKLDEKYRGVYEIIIDELVELKVGHSVTFTPGSNIRASDQHGNSFELASETKLTGKVVEVL